MEDIVFTFYTYIYIAHLRKEIRRAINYQSFVNKNTSLIVLGLMLFTNVFSN